MHKISEFCLSVYSS